MHLAYRNSGWDFCLKFTAERLKKALYRIVTHRLRSGCDLMIVGGSIPYRYDQTVSCRCGNWKF